MDFDIIMCNNFVFWSDEMTQVLDRIECITTQLLLGRNDKNRQICILWPIKWLFFILIGIWLFLLIQKVLLPEWNWPQFNENMGWEIESFRSLEEDSLDVVYAGVSHMQYGISPMEIYRDYGIVSYNLSSNGQPLDMTYYILEEMFKTQSPSYVVIDVSNIFFTDVGYGDANRRFVLDSFPLSCEKIEMAVKYSALSYENLSDIDKIERFNSVIFPIISYHTNWEKLFEGNFSFDSNVNYCTAGYVISTSKDAVYTDIDGMNYIEKIMLKDTELNAVIKKVDGKIESIKNKSNFYNIEIGDFQRENIEKIKLLCEENNSKLIITKVPSIGYPYVNGSSWTAERYNATKQLAEELGIDYFDILYDTNAELDFENDFRDAGFHLNYLGAIKVSECLGKYLFDSYGIGGKNCIYMDENMDTYTKLTNMAKLQLENDFFNYSQLLKENEENYIVCISAKEYWKNALSGNDILALNTLGLYDEIKEYSNLGNSYVALIDGGLVEHEEISNRNILYLY